MLYKVGSDIKIPDFSSTAFGLPQVSVSASYLHVLSGQASLLEGMFSTKWPHDEVVDSHLCPLVVKLLAGQTL